MTLYLFLKSLQYCVHLITHWEGGNLCIFIKYSSEWMGEARLCRWLLSDGGNLWKFKWIETKFGVCCVNHISRSEILMSKRLKITRNFIPLSKMWPKVSNEVLSFFLINAVHLLNELIKWFTVERWLFSQHLSSILHRDWFKIWSWLNYSWILYYPVGSLCSVVPMLARFYFL